MAKTKVVRSVAEYNARDNASKVVVAYSERVGKSMKKMGDRYNKTARGIKTDTSKISKSTQQLKNSFSTLGKTMVAAFGVRFLAGFTKDLISSYETQLIATQRLQVSLKNAGITAKGSAKDIGLFASKMQGLVGIGDEVILPMIQRFVEMGQTIKQAETSFGVLADFAAGTGLKIEKAFKIMTTALGGSTTSLEKYGIEVDGTQEKGAILVDVLAQMNKLFAGQAAALNANVIGTMKSFGNAVGDVKENLGGKLANTTFFKGLAVSLSGLASDLSNSTFNFDAFGASTKDVEKQLAHLKTIKRELDDEGFFNLDFSNLFGYKSIAIGGEIKQLQNILQDKADKQAAIDEAKFKEKMAAIARSIEKLRRSEVEKKYNMDADTIPFDFSIPVEFEESNPGNILFKALIAANIELDHFKENLNSLPIETLGKIPEALKPGQSDGIGESTALIEGLTKAQLKQYDTNIKQANGAQAWASAVFGANEKVAKVFAAVQGGIEIAAGLQALGNHDWIAAGNHFASARAFADVAGKSSSKPGGSGSSSYDPLQAGDNKPATTIIVTTNFDQDGFNTTISNSAVDAVVDDIRSDGRVSDTIRRVL